MFPVDLIDELFEKIVSYLDPQNVISLTETCHQAMVDVEALARRELDRIEREHNVDDTWRSRVATEASQEGENGQGGVLIPSDSISHRRMLRSAYRTYLYSVIESSSTQAGGMLAMHPNGRHLLCGGSVRGEDEWGIVHLWDISTNECIKSLVGHWGFYVSEVGFSANHIVSSASEEAGVRIWSMNGECKHHIEDLFDDIRHATVCALAVSNESVYLVDYEGPIYVINTITGAVRSMREQPWGDHMFAQELGICKSYLLNMRRDSSFKNDADIVENYAGVYVFDRDSEQLQSRFPGDYCSMACTIDGSVAIATFDGEIKVLQVQDGHLVPQRSIFLSHPVPSWGPTILHLAKSWIFFLDASLGERRTTIVVYNTVNGMMERRLKYPTGYSPVSITSNEKEVFVAFRLGRGEKNRESYTIKAFLLR